MLRLFHVKMTMVHKAVEYVKPSEKFFVRLFQAAVISLSFYSCSPASLGVDVGLHNDIPNRFYIASS